MTAPNPKHLKARIASFQRKLFAFYKENGRTMPWRNTRDPYRILVSEIMLQQTQVDRVRLKYQEFLKRFPTLKALARAPLGEVLRAWSGLGYNRRAKYLHACAKKVAEIGGAFPRTMEEIRKLPGIGRSTGAGVLAFAWNFPEPMIDTNVRRVLHRVFFPRRKKTDEELYHFAKAMIPEGMGREWNYAILDLAATKCTARNHASDCPLRALHGPVVESVRKRNVASFVDSDRYARGKIIEALRIERRGLGVPVLMRKAERTTEKTCELLAKLTKEGLVVKRGTRFVLP